MEVGGSELRESELRLSETLSLRAQSQEEEAHAMPDPDPDTPMMYRCRCCILHAPIRPHASSLLDALSRSRAPHLSSAPHPPHPGPSGEPWPRRAGTRRRSRFCFCFWEGHTRRKHREEPLCLSPTTMVECPGRSPEKSRFVKCCLTVRWSPPRTRSIPTKVPRVKSKRRRIALCASASAECSTFPPLATSTSRAGFSSSSSGKDPGERRLDEPRKLGCS